MVTLSTHEMSVEEISRQLQHFDDNKGPHVIAIVSVFFAFALILVLLRFVTRTIRHIKYGLEDYLIIVALVLALGLYISAILAVRFGLGQHSLKVFSVHGIEFIVMSLQNLLALQFVYNAAHVFIKISILFLYKRIFTFIVAPFKYVWYITFVYVICNFVVAEMLLFLQCRPFSYSWQEPLGVEGHCHNLKAFELTNGALVAFADIILLALPLPSLWALRVSLKQKVLLCGLFGLGFLATIGSIIRLTHLAMVKSSVDFTYDGVDTLVWSLIEVDLGIVCACIPTIKPLFAKKSAQPTPVAFENRGRCQNKASGHTHLEKNSSSTEKSSSSSSGSMDDYLLSATRSA